MKDSIEEAAERMSTRIMEILFKDEKKWQQERSYSEEEVLAMLLIKHDGLTPEYVLEQFKKK